MKIVKLIKRALGLPVLTYKEEKRDLFSVSEDYMLCHCISADFGMSGGIVLMFNKIFDMKNKMLTLHANEGIKKWDTLCTGYVIQEDKVFNLITKRNVYEQPAYTDLTASLLEMKKLCKEQGIKKLAMPQIGCGIDGLEWNTVSTLIKEVFYDMDMEILVCIWK